MVGKKVLMFRATTILATLLWLVVGSSFVGRPVSAQAPKSFTPEQIAEIAILAAGSRPVLTQIRRNGIERGRVSRIGQDGRSEDTRYELRFVRGDKPEKDKFRIDNKTPQAEYSLIFGDGKIFGIINGSPFQPRAEATADFISQQAHSIDALLRYKENESKVASAGKDKHQGIDVHVLDLTDKANRHTRYFVSAKTYRVLLIRKAEGRRQSAVSSSQSHQESAVPGPPSAPGHFGTCCPGQRVYCGVGAGSGV